MAALSPSIGAPSGVPPLSLPQSPQTSVQQSPQPSLRGDTLSYSQLPLPPKESETAALTSQYPIMPDLSYESTNDDNGLVMATSGNSTKLILGITAVVNVVAIVFFLLPMLSELSLKLSHKAEERFGTPEYELAESRAVDAARLSVVEKARANAEFGDLLQYSTTHIGQAAVSTSRSAPSAAVTEFTAWLKKRGGEGTPEQRREAAFAGLTREILLQAPGAEVVVPTNEHCISFIAAQQNDWRNARAQGSDVFSKTQYKHEVSGYHHFVSDVFGTRLVGAR